MLTKHVIGADGTGRDIEMPEAEEAETRAAWAAEDAKPKVRPRDRLADALAELETLKGRLALVESSQERQKGQVTA